MLIIFLMSNTSSNFTFFSTCVLGIRNIFFFGIWQIQQTIIASNRLVNLVCFLRVSLETEFQDRPSILRVMVSQNMLKTSGEVWNLCFEIYFWNAYSKKAKHVVAPPLMSLWLMPIEIGQQGNLLKQRSPILITTIIVEI